MKRHLLACLGGTAVVAAVTLSAPLAAAADSYVPIDPCETSCSSTVVNVPQRDAGPSLADTGSSIAWPIVGLAGVAVFAGGGAIALSRRRANNSN